MPAALLALALAGCSEEPGAPRPPAAPILARATLVLEPPRLGVGQVGELELAVVTPPGHTPRPWTPPEELEGIWILGSEALPVEKTEVRWVHRTRVRVRARAVGGFVWPGESVEVDAPDGSTARVAWEELAVEVPSLIPEYPGRTAPFGARAPARVAEAPTRMWGPAAAGALFTLACVGLVALARRRRRDAAVPSPEPVPAAAPPWLQARAALEAADALAGERPFEAAHATALALRRYVERRFGAPAAGRTTEELADATPPFAATSRWPTFVAVLEGLDAFRFRSQGEADTRESAASRVGALLEDAHRFVEDSVPPESRQ